MLCIWCLFSLSPLGDLGGPGEPEGLRAKDVLGCCGWQRKRGQICIRFLNYVLSGHICIIMKFSLSPETFQDKKLILNPD